MDGEKRKNYTRLGILVQEDPRAAAREIKQLLSETRGNASEASRRLGIGHASLLRYFRRLREAGHPVREKGKVGRSSHEDDPEFVARTKEIRDALKDVAPCFLTDRQWEVVVRRYPSAGKPQSCVRIAQDLGITRQAVQKTERAALAKLGLGDG